MLYAFLQVDCTEMCVGSAHHKMIKIHPVFFFFFFFFLNLQVFPVSNQAVRPSDVTRSDAPPTIVDWQQSFNRPALARERAVNHHVWACQVTIIYLVLSTTQIVSKQLHTDNIKIQQSLFLEENCIIVHP